MTSHTWRRLAAPLGLLIAAAICGCSGGGAKPPPNAEVSGKVTYNGKPVPGGEVSFVTVKGGFASGGMIDENGNYKVTVPVGDVKITVTNAMLRTGRGVPAGGGGGRLKRPDSEPPKEIKGHYINLPPKYANADTTELTYTVQRGSQTHDIELR